MRATGRGMGRASSRWATAGAIPAIIIAAAVALGAMGRSPICPCGTVTLWHGTVQSPENSQQIADWYSLSHVVHGLIFYALARLVLPRWPVHRRLALAVLVEAAWEVLENSPLIIDRYRAVTMAWGYAGDSIVNSASDIAMMMLGFAIAARLPWRWSVALAIALELVALAAIRDNLTLNVLMLVAPSEAIRAWQTG